jgi:CubicO group peptidase (beta-lactamase class C family)
MNWLMRVLLLIIVVAYMAQFIVPAQEPLDDADIAAILRDRVDAAKKSPGIVVGIIDERGPRIISCGRSGWKEGPILDGDTVFEIGSVTKVFTSLILADMVTRGEVKLDDPISKYLPARVKVPSRTGREITLADLATHTSGLPRLPDNFAPSDAANPYADYTVAQLYDFLASYSLKRSPGVEYEYSNVGGGLLGHILALKAGTNYEALVIKEICQPLGMTNTLITLTAELQARLAQGHNEAGHPTANWDMPALAGAGALRSTANDLLKLLAASMGREKTVLQPAMELAETPRHEAGSAGMKIGLGWHIASNYGTELVWHNGGTGGYRSFIGFNQKKQQAVVVMANSANSVDDIGFHLLERKYPLEKAARTTNQTAIQMDAKILDRYVGRYQFNETIFFNVRRAEEHLQGRMTGQSYLDLYSASENEFFYDVVKAQITFNPATNGQPANLVLHQGGLDQTAQKVSDEAPR